MPGDGDGDGDADDDGDADADDIGMLVMVALRRILLEFLSCCQQYFCHKNLHKCFGKHDDKIIYKMTEVPNECDCQGQNDGNGDIANSRES